MLQSELGLCSVRSRKGRSTASDVIRAFKSAVRVSQLVSLVVVDSHWECVLEQCCSTPVDTVSYKAWLNNCSKLKSLLRVLQLCLFGGLGGWRKCVCLWFFLCVCVPVCGQIYIKPVISI